MIIVINDDGNMQSGNACTKKLCATERERVIKRRENECISDRAHLSIGTYIY